MKDTIDKFEDIADQTGLRVLGWREVPKDSSLLGPAASSREPVIMQPFLVMREWYGNGDKPKDDFEDNYDAQTFERQLYVFPQTGDPQDWAAQLVLSLLAEQ